MLNNAVSGPWGKSSSVDTVTNVTRVLLQKLFAYLAVSIWLFKISCIKMLFLAHF